MTIGASLLLIIVLYLAQAFASPDAPNAMIWVRIRSDPKLKSFLDWSEFGVEKGATMREAVERVAHQGGLSLGNSEADFSLDQDLYLYRVMPVDLGKTLAELEVQSGEKFYLTNEDLVGR